MQPNRHRASSFSEHHRTAMHNKQQEQGCDTGANTSTAMVRGAPVAASPLTGGDSAGLQTVPTVAKESRRRDRNAQPPRKGEIRYLENGKRKRFNGRQWRTLCVVDSCDKEAQGKTDVCSRHLNRTPVHLQQRASKATGIQKHGCMSSLAPPALPSGTSTPTEEDSQDSLSFGAAYGGKRSCSSVSELSNTSSVSNEIFFLSEREQEAAHSLMSLKNSRTNTPYHHTPINSPDFTTQGNLPQAFSTPSNQHPRGAAGSSEGVPSSKRTHFQRHSSQGSLLDEGIYMPHQTCASVPPCTEENMDASSVEEPKPTGQDVSEVDGPLDMELACMESMSCIENSDSALPEDFPTTASESQLSTSNMASSSTCLLSDEGQSTASQGTASVTAMDMSSSYQKLPPLSHIARCPTQQRRELMAQMPRSHSLPDLKSNVYDLQPSQSDSPVNDGVQLQPVKFTEKPLLKARQPKVYNSSAYPTQHSDLQTEHHRLPQVTTGSAQPLVKSQISAFVIPQKQGLVGCPPEGGMPHPKEGVQVIQSGPSHPASGSLAAGPVCSVNSVPSTASGATQRERTIASISRLTLHSSTPSPIANPDLPTPPFTPFQGWAPQLLPSHPSVDMTASFLPAVKRNGGLAGQQVHIAPKSSCVESGTVQQLSNSFKRKRARPHLEDKQSLVMQGIGVRNDEELPSIYNPPQQKQFSCRRNYPNRKDKWCLGCERKKGGCVNLNSMRRRGN